MSNRKSFRVGERNINRQGLTMEIVKYASNKSVEIVFLETGERKVVRYLNFLHGNVGANLVDHPYIVVKQAKKFARATKIALAAGAAIAFAALIIKALL